MSTTSAVTADGPYNSYREVEEGIRNIANSIQLLMARILAAQERPLSPEQRGMSPATDPLFQAAKEDARKCLEILDLVGGAPEMQKTRTEVLRTAFADITW